MPQYNYWNISNFANLYKNCNTIYSVGVGLNKAADLNARWDPSITQLNFYHAFDNCSSLRKVCLPEGGPDNANNINITGMLANKSTSSYTDLSLRSVFYPVRDRTGSNSVVGQSITWTPISIGAEYNLRSVAYADGTWVIATYVTEDGIILTSTDLMNWTSRTISSHRLYSVAYGNGTWVAVGDNGTIMTSTNLINWTSRDSDIYNSLLSVAYNNGIWITVGNAGIILTSTNLINWIPRSSGTSVLYSIVYDNDTWVAVGYRGDNGTILTSTNLETWSFRDTDVFGLFSVAYGNGTWVAVGDNGTIVTSDNLINWTSRDSDIYNSLLSVAYANDTWVAVSNGGTISISNNAINWDYSITNSTFKINASY